MSQIPYDRVKVDYKKEPLKISVKLKSENKKHKEAQSLIAQVLMANSGLNPAQRESLRKAKDLLNG